jgi:hypothetical protein
MKARALIGCDRAFDAFYSMDSVKESAINKFVL